MLSDFVCSEEDLLEMDLLDVLVEEAGAFDFFVIFAFSIYSPSSSTSI